MKKLLALVLALVMVMGLATVGANAASFSDADSIKYQEAVDVMSAIGVIDGMNGAFNPTGTLTREQGAKIISYMLLGKTGGDALSASAAPFDDVAAERWSAGAIAYCKNVGILGGVGDNKFQPEAALTGAAFGKMLLTALGYDATKEGLGGSDWSLNVARLINKIDLANGLGSLGYSTAITRDEAAKLAFNTLTENMVEYPGAFTVKTSDGTVVDSATSATYVANSSYSYISNGAAQVYAGEGEAVIDGVAYRYMQFCENYFPNLKMESTTDSFGVPVNKWFNGSNRTDYIRDSAKTIVSVDGDELLATFTAATTPKKIRAAIGGSSADQLGIVDTAAEYAAGVDKLIVYIDGVPQNVAKATYVDKNDGDEIATTGNGVITRVYRNTNTRNVTIVINGVYLAQALADYNTKDSKLAIEVDDPGQGYSDEEPQNTWPTEVKSEDVDGLEGYKKDDLMLITAVNTGAEGGKWSIKTVTPVTNAVMGTTITAYRNGDFLATDNGTVTAGGTVYKYNRSFAKGLDLMPFSINDGTYDICLDENGYVIGVREVEATIKANDYLFVRETDVGTWEAKAKVTFMDGTESTITVAKVTNNGVDYKASSAEASATNKKLTASGAEAAENTLPFTQKAFYKFSKKSNGEYNLTTVAAVATTGETGAIGDHDGIAQSSSAAAFMESGVVKPIKLNGGTQVQVSANSKSVAVANKKAYVGVSNFPKVASDAAETAIYYLLDEYDNILAVYTGTSGSSSADKTKFAFVWDNPTTSKAGDDDLWIYGAVVDGAVTEIQSEDDLVTAEGTKELYDISTTDGNGYVEFDVSVDDGYATDLIAYTNDAAIGGAARMFEIKNSTLLVDGAAVAVVTDDTRYFKIDARDSKASANVEEIGAGTVLTLDTTATVVEGDEVVTTTTRQWNVYCFKDSGSAKTVSMIYFVRINDDVVEAEP